MMTSLHSSDMIISLTGFMGCGKSSVGRELSALLSCPLVDLDTYIESGSGRTIPEIFASEGEAAFRTMELTALKELLPADMKQPMHSPEMVLSLGGGTLTTYECADLVHRCTTCIYLRATTDTLFNNLKDDSSGRPMLSGEQETFRQRIESLMESRGPVYESTAHIIIDIDGRSFTSIAAGIESMLRTGAATLLP